MKRFKVAFLTTSFPEEGKEHVAPFVTHLVDAIRGNGDKPVVIMPLGYDSLNGSTKMEESVRSGELPSQKEKKQNDCSIK